MSTITESIKAGITRSDDGAPLGLINYMVHNRKTVGTPKVRVGTMVGWLWWTIKLSHLKQNTHIWNKS